jgi:2-methylisocitrate lyase-like PEP mutase family enzyme
MFVTQHGSVQQSGRASILRAVGVGALFVGGWWCATTLWGVSDVRWLTATVIVALWVRVWFTRKTW